jgi:hypothetical protein
MSFCEEETCQNRAKRLLVNYCSPVLFGKKPSALFMARTKKCYCCLMNLIRQFDRDVAAIILRKTENGLLVFLYKPELLHGVIRKTSAKSLLRRFGYPQENFGTENLREGARTSDTLRPYLNVLKTRFVECREFPHEIGFFLGYPIEDVLGFIRQNGKNCKYCGLWKVYGNVTKALKLFHHYRNCRDKAEQYLKPLDDNIWH